MATPAPTTKASRLHLLASIAVIVAGLYFAKEVLIPLALAIMLSFLLAPLVTRLQRWGLTRIPALIVIVLVVGGGIGGLAFVVYAQITDVAMSLPKYSENIREKAEWLGRFNKGGTIETAAKAFQDAAAQATTQAATAPAGAATQPAAVIQPTPGPDGAAALVPPVQSKDKPVNPIPVKVVDEDANNPFKNLYRSVSPFLEPLATAGIVLIFVIFMLLGREDLRDRVIRLIGQGRINVTTQAMDEAATKISKYLVAQCIVNGTYGIAISLGLYLIGLTLGHNEPGFPNWFLWGMLTAVLRFIPYIGPWIGAAFPIVLSLAVYHGMTVPLAVIGMFLVLELLSNNFMEPWLYGSSTGVSTIAILVAAIFWTWIWGTPGLLLATPLTVLIAVTGKYVPQLEFLNILLGDEPALEPKYRFYQRLLAEDVEELDELLADFLKERSVVEVYDHVVLPAMRLSEDDWHKDRLDERKQAMIRRAIRELVEEIGEKPRKVTDPTPGVAGANGTGVGPDAAPTSAVTNDGVRYERCIMCLPARDPADEIGAMMVAQVLEHAGYCAEYVSVDRLASEYVELVEKRGVQVVIISALPPGAATHARYLVKRLRQRFPELKIIVGLWTVEGDLTRAKERLGAAGTPLVVSSIAAATEQLRQVVQPLLVAESPPAAATTPAVEAVGAE